MMPARTKPPAKPTRPPKLRVNFTLDQATLDRLAAIMQAENLDSLSATIRHLSREHRTAKEMR